VLVGPHGQIIDLFVHNTRRRISNPGVICIHIAISILLRVKNLHGKL
jgi:hypothetical protein